MNIEWKKQVFGIEVDLVGNKHHDERLFEKLLQIGLVARLV